MAKISSGNVLDPRRSGALTSEDYGAIATTVVAKLANLKPRKWQYGVKISDRRSQGPDVNLTMDTNSPWQVTAKFNGTVIGVVTVEVENGVVKRSEFNATAVSEMLQRAATREPAILAILQQL
jgi:hypothetical protein